MAATNGDDWSHDTVAWTRNDGYPAPPPGAPRFTMGALGATVAAVWIGLLSVDTMCPEHRALVLVLATGALIAGVSSVIGLVGSRAWAPITTLVAAALGLGIALVDAVHHPTRGAVTAIAFGVVAIGAGALAVPQLRSLRWVGRARGALDDNPAIAVTRTPSSTAAPAAETAPPSAAPTTSSASAETATIER